MLATLDLQTVAQYSALRIVESLAEGTVIFAFAALLLRVVPRQNAGTRFAIWFSALLAIAFAPVATGIWSAQFSGSSMTLVRPAITVPDSWAVHLFAGWAILSGWFLLGVARALWHIHALKRSCAEIDVSRLDSAVHDVLRRDPGRDARNPKICTSEQVRVPTAIGLMKPVIVLPEWAIDELTPTELKQVLIHEMAHLRRRDDWTNLVQQVVKAIFFFHPAVWWIEKEASLEREIACDDAVLEQTESPRAYAECLAHLAERSFIQRTVALAQAVLGRIRQTSTRVAQILDGNRPRGTRAWKPAVSLVAGFAIVFSIGASRLQRLIAFQGGSPAQMARTSDPDPARMAHSASSSLVHNAVLREVPAVKPTQTKLVTRSAEKISPTRQRSTKPMIKRKPQEMIHLASAKDTPAPVQETVFVLIQGTELGAAPDAISQVQMWRVTVLRYVIEPTSSTTPRKQI